MRYISTRGQAHARDFAGVLLAGLAEDGGLFVPAQWPVIDAEGWLHTGDVGTVDEDGFFRITDRMKDIIITAGGKNITPSEIENALKCSPFIKEAIVVADRRRFVSALIQIDFDNVSRWATEQGLLFTNFRSLVDNASVSDMIQREVDRANEPMPRVQQVRRFHLFQKELDHDDGEVTATMKIKRKSIYEKYASVIEAIYAELIAAHAGLGDEAAMDWLARLALILCNHIGDREVLRQAFALAHQAQNPHD